MKNWKEDRNYRKIHMVDGTVKNMITVDGIDVAVSDEVFKVYSQMDRQERYMLEDQQKDRALSLERLGDDDMHLEYLTKECVPSAEEIVIVEESENERDAMIALLPKVLGQFTDDERELIYALYFAGVSAREYARNKGVTLHAIQKRRDRILKKLKKFFC